MCGGFHGYPLQQLGDTPNTSWANLPVYPSLVNLLENIPACFVTLSFFWAMVLNEIRSLGAQTNQGEEVRGRRRSHDGV